MDSSKPSLAKDIEELVNKSIEINKFFLSESSKFVRQFTTPGEKKTATVFNANFLSDAFAAYAKLNIQHLKNMMDLGVSLIQQANTQPSPPDTSDIDEQTTTAPSFVLKGETEQGGKISLSFLLDNIKKEAVVCTLINTAYSFEDDAALQENFVTNFIPQSFTLNTGGQQRVNINIIVPPNAKPGTYTSNVQVKGFEPAYFSMLITVTEKPNTTSTDNARKAKKKKPAIIREREKHLQMICSMC